MHYKQIMHPVILFKTAKIKLATTIITIKSSYNLLQKLNTSPSWCRFSEITPWLLLTRNESKWHH